MRQSAAGTDELDEDELPASIPNPELKYRVCQANIYATCEVAEWQCQGHNPWEWYTPVEVDGKVPDKVPNVCRYTWDALGWKHTGLGNLQAYGKSLGQTGSPVTKEQPAFLQGSESYDPSKNRGHKDSQGKKRRLRKSSKTQLQEEAKVTLDITERAGCVDNAPVDECVLEEHWD